MFQRRMRMVQSKVSAGNGSASGRIANISSKCNNTESKMGSTTLNECALRMKMLAGLQGSDKFVNPKKSDKGEIPCPDHEDLGSKSTPLQILALREHSLSMHYKDPFTRNFVIKPQRIDMAEQENRHQQLEEQMNDLLSPSPLPFGK